MKAAQPHRMYALIANALGPPPEDIISQAHDRGVVVADCDATAKSVADLGGQVIVPPQDIPKVGRFSVFMDPAGAALAVIKLAEASE